MLKVNYASQGDIVPNHLNPKPIRPTPPPPSTPSDGGKK
ncbi:hypothetical protein PSTU1396_23090 (plasmid) [Providencia stuartii]|nr:hypothetical protein [Providencia phage PSTNGR2lys]CAK6615104.1 hypothetical protein PSTU1396_15440 [Providencia stuartii]CAK6616249.1 hypothetical protein PS9952019_15440 [Providencia stuartii]CAK6619634.1 hypothetical protein PS9952019_22910 [Providencia stuartii]CAK6619712.1 hypothetical protein PSTU1396_23090 [Providencia stuartii]